MSGQTSEEPIEAHRICPNSMPINLPVEDTQLLEGGSHPQVYHAAVTVESLDAEGFGMIDPETSEEILHTFDPTHDHTHGKSVLSNAATVPLETSEGPAPTVPNRDESVAYARIREESRLGKRWWRRPSPYWLFIIQLGSALSLGMGLAPKTEIYNHLACIVHYPYASEFPAPPAQTNPVIPSPPIPSPSQPDEHVPASIHQNAFAFTRISARGLFDSGIDSINGTNSGLGSEGQPIRSIDPILCRKSPVVQAAAARFTTSMSIFQGVLAAFTTGWWGRLSDKWGRTRVLSIALTGIIFNDIVFIVTARYPTSVPGGYRFLFVGPIFDGLLGGMSTLSATNQAYVADCTPDGTRAQIFSRLVGMMMVGFALGPIVGAVIIRHFSNVLSVFYIACALHIITLFIVLFILPESLSTGAKDSLAKMARAREREIQNREELERRWEEEEDEEDDTSVGNSGWSRLSGVTRARAVKRSRGAVRRSIKRAFGFLSPLAIFLPAVDENDPKGRKNWNLTFLAIGLSFLMFMMGVLGVKFQYTQLMFGWGPAELSPLLTAIGSLRAANLLLFLPLVVRYFKPKHNGKRPEQLSASDKASDSHFDLKLIQLSLLLDVIAYFGIIMFSGPKLFVASTLVSSLGGGAGPAINSLALALLPSSRIAGRLFGATSVLSAIVSTVVAPLLFGITYAYTTRVFPKAIFVLAAVILLLALVSFSMIRLDRPLSMLEDAPIEPTLTEPHEEERGRPRTPKSVHGRSDISLRTE